VAARATRAAKTSREARAPTHAPKQSGATNKSTRRRDEILHRAIQLFDTQGYANTSLDDIARAVGIAREGIYYYFKNRAEILLSIIRPRSEALIEAVQRIVDDSSLSPAQKLHEAVRAHLEQFDKYCLEMTVSLRDGHMEDTPDVGVAMRRIWKDYEHLWTKLIEDGQRHGAFRSIGDPKMLAFGILGMCNWLARWYDPKKEAPIAELVEAYFGLIAGGLVEK